MSAQRAFDFDAKVDVCDLNIADTIATMPRYTPFTADDVRARLAAWTLEKLALQPSKLAMALVKACADGVIELTGRRVKSTRVSRRGAKVEEYRRA